MFYKWKKVYENPRIIASPVRLDKEPKIILTLPLSQSVPISTESMTTEELEKYYHKLTKKHGQMSVEIVKCGSALR